MKTHCKLVSARLNDGRCWSWLQLTWAGRTHVLCLITRATHQQKHLCQAVYSFGAKNLQFFNYRWTEFPVSTLTIFFLKTGENAREPFVCSKLKEKFLGSQSVPSSSQSAAACIAKPDRDAILISILLDQFQGHPRLSKMTLIFVLIIAIGDDFSFHSAEFLEQHFLLDLHRHSFWRLLLTCLQFRNFSRAELSA